MGLRREPTGQPRAFVADVVATAKRALAAGEALDGEGGYTVYGKLMPASLSVAMRGLPLGLAHGLTAWGLHTLGDVACHDALGHSGAQRR